MPVYKTSKELAELGLSLIKEHHEGLLALKIAFQFRKEASISNGRVIAGRARRIDDSNRELHGYDASIEIAQDIWEEASLNFRVALMDHELSHINIVHDSDGNVDTDPKTGRIKIVMRNHDIEEFSEVLERYGTYHKDLREFIAAFERNKKVKEAGI